MTLGLQGEGSDSEENLGHSQPQGLGTPLGSHTLVKVNEFATRKTC